MATLSVTTDLSGKISRQELFNMWANATLSSILEGDTSPDLVDVDVGSSFSDAPSGMSLPPGKLFYHRGEQLYYVWTDELDVMDNGRGTGVSLWLAWGPDRVETACLAAEPIPAGAAVEVYYDRWVRPAYPNRAWSPLHSGVSGPAVIGLCQSGIPEGVNENRIAETQESGTWVRVGIDGIMRAWHKKPDTGVSESDIVIRNQSLIWNWVGLTDGGDPRFRGAAVGRQNTATNAGPWTYGFALHQVTVPSGYSDVHPWVKWAGGIVLGE